MGEENAHTRTNHIGPCLTRSPKWSLVAFFSVLSSQPGSSLKVFFSKDTLMIPWSTWSEVKVAQSCPTLYDSMDYTVHRILQAGIPEWVAFPFSRGSSPNRSPALQVDSLPAEPKGKPKNTGMGSLSLLYQIFPTQESNWGLLHCRRVFTNWAMRESHGSLQFSEIRLNFYFDFKERLCSICGSAGKESACNARDLGSIPGLGISPGEVKGYPL